MEQPMRRAYLKRRSHAKLLYAALDRTDLDDILILSALRAGLAQMRTTYRKTAHLFEDLERMFPNPHHSGCTALHHAAMNGHAETVAMLVSYKANVNVKNDVSYFNFRLSPRNLCRTFADFSF
jgi:ankyrin repeat protein